MNAETVVCFLSLVYTTENYNVRSEVPYFQKSKLVFIFLGNRHALVINQQIASDKKNNQICEFAECMTSVFYKVQCNVYSVRF